MVTYCLYKDYFRSISFMLIAMGDKLKGKKTEPLVWLSVTL